MTSCSPRPSRAAFRRTRRRAANSAHKLSSLQNNSSADTRGSGGSRRRCCRACTRGRDDARAAQRSGRVALSADGAALRVDKVIPDSGAEAAGIAVGDHVTAVDGLSVTSLGLQGTIAKIRGVVGTTPEVERRPHALLAAPGSRAARTGARWLRVPPDRRDPLVARAQWGARLGQRIQRSRDAQPGPDRRIGGARRELGDSSAIGSRALRTAPG